MIAGGDRWASSNDERESMSKQTKDERIEVRLPADLKKQLIADGDSLGVSSTSAFVRFLYAEWRKRQKRV